MGPLQLFHDPLNREATGFCRGGNLTTIDPNKLDTLKVMGTNKEGRTVHSAPE